MSDAGKTRPDGMPIGTPFSSEYQPSGRRGRLKGSKNLRTRIRTLLDGDAVPLVVKSLVEQYVGEGKTALDALILAQLIHGISGSAPAARNLMEQGWGKAPNNTDLPEREDDEDEEPTLVVPTDEQMRAAIEKLNEKL